MIQETDAGVEMEAAGSPSRASAVGTVKWGTATLVGVFAGLLYGGSREASTNVVLNTNDHGTTVTDGPRQEEAPADPPPSGHPTGCNRKPVVTTVSDRPCQEEGGTQACIIVVWVDRIFCT